MALFPEEMGFFSGQTSVGLAGGLGGVFPGARL